MNKRDYLDSIVLDVVHTLETGEAVSFEDLGYTDLMYVRHKLNEKGLRLYKKIENDHVTLWASWLRA